MAILGGADHLARTNRQSGRSLILTRLDPFSIQAAPHAGEDETVEEGPVSRRPIRVTVDGRASQTDSQAIPLPDASCDHIRCDDVFEYVHDDVALAAECARLLAPGGRLSLSVPNAGPFAGVDSLNLFRYLVDVSHRGLKPVETRDVGWRRHYAVADLTHLLGDQFRIDHVSTRRLGFAELVDLSLLIGFRWGRNDITSFRRGSKLTDGIRRIEDFVRLGQSGWMLDVEATRLPSG